MSTIKFSGSEFDKLPDPLCQSFKAMKKQWDEQLALLSLDFQPTPELSASMLKVWASSLFVAESCLRRPELLIELVSSGDLLSAYTEPSYTNKLAQLTIDTEVQLMQVLRQFRRREMVRIAWRDLAGWAPLAETLVEVCGWLMLVFKRHWPFFISKLVTNVAYRYWQMAVLSK